MSIFLDFWDLLSRVGLLYIFPMLLLYFSWITLRLNVFGVSKLQLWIFIVMQHLKYNLKPFEIKFYFWCFLMRSLKQLKIVTSRRRPLEILLRGIQYHAQYLGPLSNFKLLFGKFQINMLCSILHMV